MKRKLQNLNSLKNEFSLKYEEVASKTVGKEQALTCAMAETKNLKKEILAK